MRKNNIKLAAIAAVLTFLFFVIVPAGECQNNDNETNNNLVLYFHPNSLLMSEQNGSLCGYEGVDGQTPLSGSSAERTLVSQITGQTTVLGMNVNYWSAIMVWGMRLPIDLHVSGAVTITAYISSADTVSGLIAGSGYAMGLVDLDENNNVVNDFLAEGPSAMGGNIFSTVPQPYSLTTNVDYTFKAGHALGFAVGAGATKQGYTFKVYFNSADKPSGARLPIVETKTTYSYQAGSETINILSDSGIADYSYDASAKRIQFSAKLIDYTQGLCNVTVPKTLMQKPFAVSAGSQTISSITTESSTNYYISFIHTRTPSLLHIVGTSSDATTNPIGSVTPTQAGKNPSDPSIPEITSLIALLGTAAFSFLLILIVIANKRNKPEFSKA